jgi:hypothetical protein
MAHRNIGARNLRRLITTSSILRSAHSCMLTRRLPDPMDAAVAFRSIVESLVEKRKSSNCQALCSRLPDPMDAVRKFHSELLKANKSRIAHFNSSL